MALVQDVIGKCIKKTKSGKKAILNADKKYWQSEKGRKKRKEIEYRYATKTSYLVPTEVLELRAANKHLEKSLLASEFGTRTSKPNQYRLNASIERHNTFRNSKGICRAVQNSRAKYISRSN